MKVKYIIVTVFLIFGISFVGCAKKLEYVPKAKISKTKARENIEKLLYIQINKYQPENVEITNDYMKYSLASHNITRDIIFFGSMIKTIRYENIDTIQLYAKNDYYVVMLLSANKKLIDKYFYSDEMYAKALINALEVMRKGELNTYEY